MQQCTCATTACVKAWHEAQKELEIAVEAMDDARKSWEKSVEAMNAARQAWNEVSASGSLGPVFSESAWIKAQVKCPK